MELLSLLSHDDDDDNDDDHGDDDDDNNYPDVVDDERDWSCISSKLFAVKKLMKMH